MKVKINQEAWKKFLVKQNIDINTPLPPPQIITDMPAHPPFDNSCMLSFPFYWWYEDELDECLD